jgi:hypothetical protein
MRGSLLLSAFSVSIFLAQETCASLKEYPAKTTKAHSVVLVIHGLNNRPEALEPLIAPLQENGSHVFLLKLTGHEDSSDASKAAFKRVEASDFRKDWSEAALSAQKKAKEWGVPLSSLCYSLGGALQIESLLKSNLDPSLAEFSRNILISPALAIRSRSKWVKVFSFLGPGFILPGFSPKEWRVHAGASNSAYRALFEIEDSAWGEAKTPLNRKAIEKPTLIFMDPEDELLDFEKTKEWVTSHGLQSHWKLEETRIGPDSCDAAIHHLNPREGTVGTTQFGKMIAQILEFLPVKR